MTQVTSLSTIERSLQSRIQIYKTSQLIIESIEQSRDFNHLNIKEQKVIINFLKHIQAWPLLFKLIKKWIKQELPIAWGSIAELLIELNLKNETMAEILMEAAQAQSLEVELAQCYQLDSFLPVLKNYRAQSIDSLFEQKAKHQQQLWDQFSALRAQGLTLQALKLIQDLIRFDPHNQIYRQAFNELKIEQAHHLVENKKLYQPLKKWMTPETIVAGNAQLYLTNLKQQQLTSAQLKDFMYWGAIHFTQLEQPLTALEIINLIDQPQLNELWLKFEILLSLSYWFEALHLIEEMALSYPDNPDLQLATQYEKALILWQLDQKAAALDLMLHLSSFEPDYRQAQFWIDQWRHDAQD